MEATALFEGVLGWCRDREPGEAAPRTLVDLLIQSPMDSEAKSRWLNAVRRENAAIA
jgi:hypothetical protein